MGKESITFEFTDDDGDEQEGSLPAKYEVCSRCEGKGKHVNPSIDSHGITSEEWNRDWDDDSREMYLSGGYDVTCHECNGNRVTLVIDREAIKRGSPEVKALYKQYCEIQRSLRETNAIEEMERRYGA